jgi:uncharacterized membrane protein YphA (DoxX/SURF4 family)
MESRINRPLGVTIIAVLTAIGGIIFLASGAVLLLIGIGIIFLALGIAYLVMAYGLWNGKPWAWTHFDSISDRYYIGRHFNIFWEHW